MFSGVIFYKILLYFDKLEKEKTMKGEYGRAESLTATLEDSDLGLEDGDEKHFGILDEEEEETFHLTENTLT